MRLVKRVVQTDLVRLWPIKQAQWYINEKRWGLRAADIETPLGDLHLKTMIKIL